MELVAARDALLGGLQRTPSQLLLTSSASDAFHTLTTPVPRSFETLAGSDAEVNESLWQLLVPEPRAAMRVGVTAWSASLRGVGA